MRDLLVPIFGDWGAVVAQFLLTVIIVFGLIAAVWWFVRRYSGVHFGGIGRGRVPRLAVVDAVPVDRRRRLVLVRRDNVEHLLLLGGPSDLVVEGTIQRVRQRSQAPQAAATRPAPQPAAEAPAEPEPAQPETTRPPERTTNAPIPFPVARNAPAAPGNGRSWLRPVPQPAQPAPPAPAVPAAAPAAAAAASFVEPQRPPQLQPMADEPAGPPPEEPQPPEEATADSLLPEVMTVEAAPLPAAPDPAEDLPPATFAEAEQEAAEAARQAALDLGEVEVPATAADEAEMVPVDTSGEAEMVPVDTAEEAEMAPATAPAEEGTIAPDSAVRVSDLEREMARLLDEITTRRSS